MILTPTRRKLLIFSISFFILFFFIPAMKCEEGAKVSKKVCPDGCNVDIYVSVYSALVERFCPVERSLLDKLFAGLGIAIASYLIACISDYYYSKYRDY